METNNTFLNNQQFTEEIKREIKKFLEANANENTTTQKLWETNDDEKMTTQKLWDAAKAVLRRKLIATQSYLKKQEKHRIDNLSLHLKQLEKEQQNHKISRSKKTIII